MIDTSKIYTSNNYGKFKIVKYVNSLNVVVEFVETRYTTKVRSNSIKRGQIKDRLKPIIYGVGFIGVGYYKSSFKGKRKNSYRIWDSMMRRCYSTKFQATHPAYIGCSVCQEWHNFQNFAKWFYENYIDGFHLDKDIKVDGNKIYSPQTCLFVSQKENNIKARSKGYTFINPVGDLVEIYNLTEFCRKNKLCNPSMLKVNSGKRNHHKGWTRS